MIFPWICRIIAYVILIYAIFATMALYALILASIPYIILPLFAFLAMRKQDGLGVFTSRHKIRKSSNAKFERFFVFLFFCFMFPLALWIVLIEPIVFIFNKINSVFPVSHRY